MGDYPTGPAPECPPPGAQLTDLAFRLEGADDAQPALAENSLRALPNASAPRRPALEWTWSHVAPGERPDRFGRSLPAEVWRDAVQGLWVCARADLAAPDESTPVAQRASTLRARLVPTQDLPAGEYRAVLAWRVGCPTCAGEPRGSAATEFEVP